MADSQAPPTISTIVWRAVSTAVGSVGNPLEGQVRFIPEFSAGLVASAAPPVTLLPAAIIGTLDADGALTYMPPDGGAATSGVELVATDDPAVNPTGWTYRVEFGLRYHGQPINYPAFSIEAPAGGPWDLTDLAPVPSNGGAAVVRGPTGDSWVKVLTQAEYAGLTPDPSTLYIITGV